MLVSQWKQEGRFRRLFLGVFLLLFCASPSQAQDGDIIGPAAGPKPDYAWSGIIQVNAGAEVPLYVVQLRDTVPFGANRSYLGNGVIAGINIKIRDLMGAGTGLQIADFTGLNIYRSNDATFDAGDKPALNDPVNGGAGPVPVVAVGPNASALPGDNTTLSVTHIGAFVGSARELPSGAGGIYFIITAQISATATSGHSFTIQVDDTHVGFTESAQAPHEEGGGFGIAYDAARHIVIAAQTAQFLEAIDAARTIPFGGEAAILVLLLGTGLYMIRRQYYK